MSDLEDDDPDAAAMAEAMGFSGFGMQRPSAKRKFNANADATVDGQDDNDEHFGGGSKKKSGGGGNVSKTGANNAPLGARRRQLPVLPPPSAAAGLPPRPSAVGRDVDEIDLGEEDDDGVEVAAPQFVTDQLGGHLPSKPTFDGASQPRAVIDTGPPGLPARPSASRSRASRLRSRNERPSGRDWVGTVNHAPSGAPWWEGYYDARMNENPWARLEKERGLEPRGTWLDDGAGAHATELQEAENGVVAGGGTDDADDAAVLPPENITADSQVEQE